MDLKGKRILITGADGFIGSHLVEAFLKRKCDIKAFVDRELPTSEVTINEPFALWEKRNADNIRKKKWV